jgi:hypothetical protein
LPVRQADAGAIADLFRREVLPAVAAGAVVRIVLEQPTPNTINGKYSQFSVGFSFGVWHGVLHTLGLSLEVVSGRRWKTDLQLLNKGKQGSIELARELFPQAVDMLRCMRLSVCVQQQQQLVDSGSDGGSRVCRLWSVPWSRVPGCRIQYYFCSCFVAGKSLFLALNPQMRRTYFSLGRGCVNVACSAGAFGGPTESKCQ